MGCESFKILAVVLVFCVMNEVSADPRWAWRRRRRCQKKDCVPGTWSAWSACSHSCGPRGTQYRRRPIAKPAQCGGKCLVTTIGAKACNRFCLNGGSLVRLSCQCKAGYSGVCCEKGKFCDKGARMVFRFQEWLKVIHLYSIKMKFIYNWNTAWH